MKYLYLHGLGQKPDSWNRVIKETKVSKSSRSLSLSEMLEGKAATYKESLHKVSCPVLIVCGEKDNANKKTSKELCHCLNNSNFHELMKTGHEANIEAPEELAIVLQRFYDSIN